MDCTCGHESWDHHALVRDSGRSSILGPCRFCPCSEFRESHATKSNVLLREPRRPDPIQKLILDDVLDREV